MLISVAKATEAAGVLEVELTGLTSTALKRAYRAKAKECHPDHHKDKLVQWARVDWANQTLTHWLKHHPPEEVPSDEPQVKGDCRACAGTGRVKVKQTRSFGAPLTMACVVCKGLGTVIPEENDND